MMSMQMESITWWCKDCGHRVTQRVPDDIAPAKCPKCHGVRQMTMGKYKKSKKHPKGVDIAFINSGYLNWVMEQDWFLNFSGNEELVDAIQRELDMRERCDGHFRDDKVTL